MRSLDQVSTGLRLRARRGQLALGLLSALALPAAAQAGDLTELRPTVSPLAPAEDPLIVTATANVILGPRYEGARALSLFGYPALSFRRASEPERFTAPDDGFSISLVSTPNVPMLGMTEPVVLFGPVVRYNPGRYSGEENKLTGLRDVRWTIEPGLFLELWPVEVLRFRIEARKAVSSHDGFVGNIGLDYVQPLGRFTFSVGPRLALADSRFTQAFFGVLPSEAALNPLVTAYKPQGGLYTVGGLASVSYRFSEQWRVTGYGGYNRIMDDAADSPITRNLGSRDQYTVGAKISYSFTYNGLASLLPF